MYYKWLSLDKNKRKDLLDYHLSIKSIADSNNVPENTVREELLESTSTIPNYQKKLPSVISFDEFKADTKEGKYAFLRILFNIKINLYIKI